MINRSALRKDTAQSVLKKIQETLAKSNLQSQEEDRFWKPTLDSNGNGFAVIRFLPAKQEDSLPLVKVYRHAFKIGNAWYIHECPTTIGKNCPVCEDNTKLWNSGYEKDKEIVRERKRKLRFISNILVLKDPKNEEAEGKVFLFSYGRKIYDKLISILNPEDEYTEPRDPFGFFNGCNVKLRIKTKYNYRNYDDTVVEPAPDLFDGDEDKLMEVLGKMYDLNEFVNPERFKPYDVLKEEFTKLKYNASIEEIEEIGKEFADEQLVVKEYGKLDDIEDEVKVKADKTDAETVDVDVVDAEEDDDLKFFRSLAEED